MEEVIPEQELAYQQELRKARAESGISAIQQPTKAKNISIGVLFVDFISDGIDWIGLGTIPIIGDILDLATTVFNAVFTIQAAESGARVRAVIASAIIPFLIETVGAAILPFLNDMLPSYIGGTIIARIIIKRAAKKRVKKL